MTDTYVRSVRAHGVTGRAPRRPPVESARFDLVVPWWANPLWALLALAGTMAVVSINASPTTYEAWEVPKFLVGEYPLILISLFLCLAMGLLLPVGFSPRARTIDVNLTPSRLRLLRRAYTVLLSLTLIGYAVWAASAVLQGVGLGDLIAVLQRDPGAIGALKNNARPIGGVTTLTQFAPLAVGLNLLLWRAGIRKLPTLLLLFGAALARVFFYAERLALIEVILPAALIGAMILGARPGWKTRVAIAPALGLPVVWVVFAVSEYFRSWVYYSQLTDMPFPEWVTVRLLGYYTTSYNNSALLAEAYDSYSPLPWFTLQWFWNLPGSGALAQHPGIGGLPADQWFSATLANNANVNFTNPGSFLTTYAELGFLLAALFWFVSGLIIGSLFRSATGNGNVASLLIYVAMFVSLLELPRIIYWTLGRSTPLVIGAVVLAYFWAKRPPSHELAGLRSKVSRHRRLTR